MEEEKEGEEEEEQQQKQQLQASAEVKPQAAPSVNLGDCLKEKEHKYSSFCWSSQSSRKWTMKLFFHPLDLTVLNFCILLSA